VIELVDEVVEAGLLLQAVDAGRPGGLGFQGEVHALVAADAALGSLGWPPGGRPVARSAPMGLKKVA
jgi:hypothetical protein